MSLIKIDSLNIEAGSIPSAATVDLEYAAGDLIDITGTVTITSILLQSGHERTVRFTGALTLTNGANLVLPGGANITTAAGDFAIFRGYADGKVRCVMYSAIAASGTGDMILAGVQTVTGAKTFGSAGAVGKLKVAGTTSGSTIIDATAVAGSGTVTLPTTGTLATLAGTETLSGKTLTTPILGAASATSIANGAGAAATPSYTFTGQTDLGLYKVSASQLGVSVGGSLVAVADASGLSVDSVRNRVNLGTTPVGTVAIAEYGDGKDITAVLTLTDFIVGALAGAGAALGIGNIVYAFPAGQHLELVYSFSSLALTAAGTAVATDTGLGSVIASGAVNVLSGTATFEDRLTGQTINTAAGGGAAVSALTAATAGIGTGIALNVAGSVKNVFLNSAGTWNVDNVGDLTASGTIVLKYTLM